MASSVQSTSSAASSAATPVDELRLQAGPLPPKRGEIGYQEEVHGEAQGEGSGDGGEADATPLPERHPADRDAPSEVAASPEVLSSTTATPVVANSPASAEGTRETSSTHSTSKNSIISFLRPKTAPLYGGIRLTTLLLFTFQILFALGTIVAWVLAATRLQQASNSDQSGNKDGFGTASSTIFVHVLFAIALLGQILFLERRLFRLRAERYGFLHPGEILPSSSHRTAPSDTSMSFAPWNRPALPTYAAALAQSGHGTGDVEDHLIAAPPPPAYGNTRGSTLLLAGFLRNSLRAQRPSSVHSRISVGNDRPISYMSRDEEWEVICDAARATRLEHTLARLEEGTVNVASAEAARG